MIIVHHLNDSRSQRILWLCEELGVEYSVAAYSRDAATRLAPPELKAVHPLGKSPVIEDGALRLAESGAIVDYLIRTYGNVDVASSARIKWLHRLFLDRYDRLQLYRRRLRADSARLARLRTH